MQWNEVTRIAVEGKIIAVKDAMILLSEDEDPRQWPAIRSDPGEYVFEVNVPTPFHAHRARIRKMGSAPELGKEIGAVDIDHAFLGIIDYETFLSAVKQDADAYSEWTATELDDELAINFSGAIDFNDATLLYVKSGDGDGRYPCFELVQDGVQVGMECIFIP
ncbi:MAG: hypothetical protein QNJ22_23970 [Desulfosarcinaceae bacterium]|nr:hypothetical protein [Desulfosarcinaceae bacterium]